VHNAGEVFKYELIAEGDQGDEQWKAKFESVKEVQQILGQLDAIGRQKDINWYDLIGSHKYFAKITALRFPPLYDLAEFADLSNDFWHTLDPPEDDDRPMQSFNWSRLYVRESGAEIVETEFAQFLSHIKSLPWIKELL
jgi:hypothetical protein